ncbi:MAG: HEAT repeat domain-containing protein, partial [Planctomycetes bacterium]|nr:HEAT repeat domain-containing protein [Planctomycetota bacterium]
MTFDEICSFSPDWLQAALRTIAEGRHREPGDEAADWYGALERVALGNCRWVASGLRELLPCRHWLRTEHFLHALWAVDPREAVDAATALRDQASEADRLIARIFLAGLPEPMCDEMHSNQLRGDLSSLVPTAEQRLPDGVPTDTEVALGMLAALLMLSPSQLTDEERERVRRLADAPSPAIVSRALEILSQTRPFDAVCVALAVFGQSESRTPITCRQAAADFLVRSGPLGRAIVQSVGQGLGKLQLPPELCLAPPDETIQHFYRRVFSKDAKRLPNRRLTLMAARALIRWAPDDALDVLTGWAERGTTVHAAVSVEVLFELVAMEKRWPSAVGVRRIEQAWSLGRQLAESSLAARSRVLPLLAEVGRPPWPEVGVKSLIPGSLDEMIRLNAVDRLDRFLMEQASLPEAASGLTAFEDHGRSSPPTMSAPSGEAESEANDGRSRIIAAIHAALHDSNRSVRRRAFLAVRRLVGDDRELTAILRSLTEKNDLEIALEALRWAAEHRLPQIQTIAKPLLRHHEVKVRLQALGICLPVSLEPRLLNQVRRLTRHGHWEVRRDAVALLGQHGSEQDLPVVTRRLADSDEDVREAALQAACRLAPEQAVKLAERMLTDPERCVVEAALRILRERVSAADVVERILRRLPRARDHSGEVLLDVIQKEAPTRWEEAARLALRSQSLPAAKRAAKWFLRNMPERPGTEHVDLLRTLLQHWSPDVRAAACRRLAGLKP